MNHDILIISALVLWAIDKIAMYAIIKDAIVSAARKLKDND